MIGVVAVGILIVLTRLVREMVACLHVSDASCLVIINRNGLIPLLRQGVQRFAFHGRELFSARPSRMKLEDPRADSGMREVERCTDVTNAVVGEADGAPCWQSERHRFGGGLERGLEVTVQTLSTGAWLRDRRRVF